MLYCTEFDLERRIHLRGEEVSFGKHVYGSTPRDVFWHGHIGTCRLVLCCFIIRRKVGVVVLRF